MAKNDAILIDGIIAERQAAPTRKADVGEEFEWLSIQQILKDYDLSDDQLESGWIDGQHDGGIDAIYLLVNGHFVDDISSFIWPRSSASIELIIINCKHHETFREATLNTLVATCTEFFDLSVDSTRLSGTYSTALRQARDRFASAYKRLAILSPSVDIKVYYASRGDTSEVGDSIRSRSNQLTQIVSSFFSGTRVDFVFLGSGEIISEYRRQKTFFLSLPFHEVMTGVGHSYVILTNLIDYFRFVTSDQGGLRRYLFDSNVRDYLGDNRVNGDIMKSLSTEDDPEFWWLNNGITILASNATISGKYLQIKDIQIVNGLQTTESIYRHFSSGKTESSEKSVAIKVIVSDDPVVRDKIIRATNNQSAVEQSSLRATDKIQRDIEQILEKNDWYYERRKNYFKNEGKPPERFVTPLYLAAGYLAVCRKNPADAARLKGRFMTNERAYRMVFSEKVPIELWPVLAALLKRSEATLLRYPRLSSERYLRNWRGLLSMLAAACHLGKFNYGDKEFADADWSKLSDDKLVDIWAVVAERRGGKLTPARDVVHSVCDYFEKHDGITGKAVVGTFVLPGRGLPDPPPLPAEFVEKVRGLLPKQPWPVGVHSQIAAQLGVDANYSKFAIATLIRRGEVFDQRDGVLFDLDGNIVSPPRPEQI